MVARFLAAKKAVIEDKVIKLSVTELVGAKPVSWVITYRVPSEITVTDRDETSIDLTRTAWPLH